MWYVKLSTYGLDSLKPYFAGGARFAHIEAALLMRPFIDGVRFTQEHYDRLTSTFRSQFGPLHPDDFKVPRWDSSQAVGKADPYDLSMFEVLGVLPVED